MLTDAPFSLYPYDPVKPLPIIFTIIVFGLGVYHAIQTFFRYKWPRFGFMMIWASAVWMTGFITRAYSVYHPTNIPIFICQYVLILAGPPIFAAAETFILGRLYAYLPYHAPILPGRVLSTFFILGIAVEVLASNGASRIANNSGTSEDNINARNVGITLLKASLILQALLEILFFSLVACLHRSCTRPGNFFPHNVKVMCYLLYVTSSMMFVRCVVRAAEGFELGACGPTSAYCGPVQQDEWFLWVFEVANITIFVAALAIFTPGKYLDRDTKRFLDQRDGITEREGPGFENMDKRPFIATVLDPFNVGALIRGKKPFPQFWLEEWPAVNGSWAQNNVELRAKGLKK